MRLLRWLLIAGILVLVVLGGSWIIYMPNAQERGVWRSTAGGMLLHLTPLQAKLYRETSKTCFEQLSFPAHMELVRLSEGATVEIQGDQLALHLDGALDTTVFDKIDGLPDACAIPDPTTATPAETFDVMWTAMHENYAFFDLHGVDWAARKAFAPTPTEALSDVQLLARFESALQGLDDGHVQLIAGDLGYYSPAQRPAWLPDDDSLTRNDLRAVAQNAAGTPLTQTVGAPIFYGLRDDGIGYIHIREMDVSRPLGGSSLAQMAATFDSVLNALAGARGLIIDVRYNPGGSDPVAFGIASHFTGEPVAVFTKTSRIAQGQSAPFTATLHPFDDTPHIKPVIVLTSQLTGSAAEIFTLTMRDLPQVTILGEATSGGLSDILDFTLPNGWQLGLSNQTYLTMDGALFEGIGIPPERTVTFDASVFLAGKDAVLEAAITLLSQGE